MRNHKQHIKFKTQKIFLGSLFILISLHLIHHKAFGQGNIPKGYREFKRIIPPDTTLPFTEVFWPYNNDRFLFIAYGYHAGKQGILVFDTKNWTQVAWIKPARKFDEIFGLSKDFTKIILRQTRYLLFFSFEKYQEIDYLKDQTTRFSKRELPKRIEEKGKLEPGKTFNFRAFVLSPDRNFLLVKEAWSKSSFQNLDDHTQKFYELVVFKFTGKE